MELLVLGAVVFGGWRIKKYFEEKEIEENKKWSKQEREREMRSQARRQAEYERILDEERRNY